MGPGCGRKANYRCNKCNVVWAQDVVGRPTTGVTSVTLFGPRVWWKANYRCNKCNVVWAQDVVGKPTTGWWLNSWGCIAIFFIVIYFLCSAVSNPRDCSKRFTFHPLADLFIPNPPHLFWCTKLLFQISTYAFSQLLICTAERTVATKLPD